MRQRQRPKSFADHYSQARQFYISQTPVEQLHIVDAFTFELSKVETPAIRERMVANLLNVSKELAEQVANGLGMRTLPEASTPAKAPIDLPPSAKLSILKNGPGDFRGRKLGLLLTEGASADLIACLYRRFENAGACVAVVAPTAGAVNDSDGNAIRVDERIDGGPSVLFDAVAILCNEVGCKTLLSSAAARDFVSDAFNHCKYIAYNEAASPLFPASGLAQAPDKGCVKLNGAADVENLLEECTNLRYWERKTS